MLGGTREVQPIMPDHDDGRNGEYMPGNKPPRPSDRQPIRLGPLPQRLVTTEHETQLATAIYALAERVNTVDDDVIRMLPVVLTFEDSLKAIDGKISASNATLSNEVGQLRRAVRDFLSAFAGHAEPLAPGTLAPPRAPAITAHELAKELAEEMKTNPGFPIPGMVVTESERVRRIVDQHQDSDDAEKWRRQIKTLWSVLGVVMAAAVVGILAMAWRMAVAFQEANDAHARGVAEGRASNPVVTVPMPVPTPAPPPAAPADALPSTPVPTPRHH